MAADQDRLVLPRAWRWAGYVVLAVVMALGVWGYTSPDVILSWDTLLALCGLG